MRDSITIGENRVVRSFLRMNIYRSIKFASDHAAPVPRVDCRLRGVGFFRIPDERAESARVPFAIAPARPGRLIAGLGMFVPNERLAVSCGLIRSFAVRDIREQQQRRTANKKKSFPHVPAGLANMPDNQPDATSRAFLVPRHSLYVLAIAACR